MNLMPEDVIQIKEYLFQGLSQSKVARIARVSQSHINKIFLGMAWRDIPWPNGQTGGFEEATGRRSNLQKKGEVGWEEKVRLQKAAMWERDKARGFEGMKQSAGPDKPVEPDKPTDPIEQDERAAIEQARNSTDRSFFRSKKFLDKMYELNDEMDKEEEREFLEKITTKLTPEQRKERKAAEEKRAKEPRKTFWDAPFLEWSEVVERVPDNEIVQATLSQASMSDSGHPSSEPSGAEGTEQDNILKRAVGVVFSSLPTEDWGSEQAVKLVAQVVGQLREASEGNRGED